MTYSYKCNCNTIYEKHNVKVDDRDKMPYCPCGIKMKYRVPTKPTRINCSPHHIKDS